MAEQIPSSSIWKVRTGIIPEGSIADEAFAEALTLSLAETAYPPLLYDIAVDASARPDTLAIGFSFITTPEDVVADSILTIREAHARTGASIGRVLSLRAVDLSLYGDRADRFLSNGRLTDMSVEAQRANRRWAELERTLQGIQAA